MFPYAKGQFTKDAQYSEFVKHFLGESCDNLPKEQAYVFDEGVSDGQTELYQDNGVMVINRTINIKKLRDLCAFDPTTGEVTRHSTQPTLWSNGIEPNNPTDPARWN